MTLLIIAVLSAVFGVVVWFLVPPEQASPEKAPPIPAQVEPVLYLEPDYVVQNPNGGFSLQLVNRGPDIEYVSVHIDYFVTVKRGESVTINRIFQFEEAPTPLPLKTNQSKQVNVSFSGDYMTALYAHLGLKYPALLGAKVTVRFRRYSDGKTFRRVWPYAVVGLPGDGILYTKGTAFDSSGPPENKDRAISLSEVVPYIDSPEHWVDPVVTIKPDGSIETH